MKKVQLLLNYINKSSNTTGNTLLDALNSTRKVSSTQKVTGNSNFGKFIKLFESDDSGRIEEINVNIEFQE